MRFGLRARWARPAALVFAFAGFVGCGGARIDRVQDGVVRSESYVPDTAYAAALAGVIAEERGDIAAARKHYENAMSHSGDAWLAKRIANLRYRSKEKSPENTATPADVLSQAISKPATDIVYLDAAEALARHPALVLYLLDRSIERMLPGERDVTTPRIAEAIAALFRSGHPELAAGLAEKLVVRAIGPYGAPATDWLVVRLAADEAIAAGHYDVLPILRRRGHLSLYEMQARAILLREDDARKRLAVRAAHLGQGDDQELDGAASGSLSPARWMLTARELCAASTEAFHAWSKGRRPPELERDPLYAAFTRSVPCYEGYEASRRQSTASTGRSNHR